MALRFQANRLREKLALPHVLLVRVAAEMDVGTLGAAGVEETQRSKGGGLAAVVPHQQARLLVPHVAIDHGAGNEPSATERCDAVDAQAPAFAKPRLHLCVRPEAGPHLKLQERPNGSGLARPLGNDVLRCAQRTLLAVVARRAQVGANPAFIATSRRRFEWHRKCLQYLQAWHSDQARLQLKCILCVQYCFSSRWYRRML